MSVSHATIHGRVSQEEGTADAKCLVCEYEGHVQGLSKKDSLTGLL